MGFSSAFHASVPTLGASVPLSYIEKLAFPIFANGTKCSERSLQLFSSIRGLGVVSASLWTIGESDAKPGSLRVLLAELRGPRLQAATKQAKQSVQAARTSLPSGLQVTVFTGKDKTSECPALCTAANHKIT